MKAEKNRKRVAFLQLFCIFFTHLGFLLFLRFLFILFIFILLRFLLIFLVVLLLVVITLLVLSVLILLLLLMFTEHTVITRLIVIRIQTQCILVSLDGLTIHLMRLTDNTDVMECLCLP